MVFFLIFVRPGSLLPNNLGRQFVSRVLMDALAAGGAEAKRVFTAMMEMGKINVAKIEAARRG